MLYNRAYYLTLILMEPEVINLCQQYRARPACTPAQSDHAGSILLADHLQVPIFISLKLIRTLSKMEVGQVQLINSPYYLYKACYTVSLHSSIKYKLHVLFLKKSLIKPTLPRSFVCNVQVNQSHFLTFLTL